VRWRARIIVQGRAARRAGRPQLKREPLGSGQAPDVITLRRALLIAVAIEIPLVVALAIWGIPSPVAHDPIGRVIEATHAPGVAFLESLGLCCGFGNSLVVGDVWSGPVQHPSLVGLCLLFASNLVVLAGLMFLVLLGLRLLNRPVGDAAA